MKNQLIALLSIPSIACSMLSGSEEGKFECLMPYEKQLNEVICKEDGYFCEKVDLPKRLAEQKLNPVGVSLTVKHAIADFSENIGGMGAGEKYLLKDLFVKKVLNASQCNWVTAYVSKPVSSDEVIKYLVENKVLKQ